MVGGVKLSDLDEYMVDRSIVINRKTKNTEQKKIPAGVWEWDHSNLSVNYRALQYGIWDRDTYRCEPQSGLSFMKPKRFASRNVTREMCDS